MARWLRIYAQLGKARLTALVSATAAAGFVLAADSIDAWLLCVVTAGTFLVASGANAFNQWLEVDVDARMERTRSRPLPAGAIGRAHALRWSIAVAFAGQLLLIVSFGLLPAVLALLAALLYIVVYTPLKTRTPLNTIVGAVVGAVPPLIGWSAASGRLELGGFLLALVLFLWQMPHFLALAWRYRDEYASAGFCMLPASDPDGALTTGAAMLYSIALIPTGLLATLAGLQSASFAVAAVVLGLWLTWRSMNLRRERTRLRARQLLIATLLYLPLLLGMMIVDQQMLEPGVISPDWVGGLRP